MNKQVILIVVLMVAVFALMVLMLPTMDRFIRTPGGLACMFILLVTGWVFEWKDSRQRRRKDNDVP